MFVSLDFYLNTLSESHSEPTYFTSTVLYILISPAYHNSFSSCLAVRSIWLSSTERQGDYAESGESLRTVGTGETTHRMM